MVFIIVNGKAYHNTGFPFSVVMSVELSATCKKGTWGIHKNNRKERICKYEKHFTLNCCYGLYTLFFRSIWSAMGYINSSREIFRFAAKFIEPTKLRKLAMVTHFWVDSNWDQYLAQHLPFQKCDKWVNTN